MQMGLMPTVAPVVKGLDLAGRCVPANHVGGDFYQYFHQDGRLLACLADVSGKAMEAAIPVVMFDGFLESQMERVVDLEEMFSCLNRSLHRVLGRHTFVAFAMVEIDAATSTVRLCNAGCPYPYHYVASEDRLVELQGGAYPLGVRPDTAYEAIGARLALGDGIVLCSDGVIESVDPEGQLLGFERTAGVVLNACRNTGTASETIESILGGVSSHRDTAGQTDDVTCVAIRVLGR